MAWMDFRGEGGCTLHWGRTQLTRAGPWGSVARARIPGAEQQLRSLLGRGGSLLLGRGAWNPGLCSLAGSAVLGSPEAAPAGTDTRRVNRMDLGTKASAGGGEGGGLGARRG